MRIEPEIARFLSGFAMIIVGTRDSLGQPNIARGAGARILPDSGLVDVVISGWQWPDTVADLRANGRIAVTFSRPSDYVSYQIKGAATPRTAEDSDMGLSQRYIESMMAAFAELGVLPDLSAPWMINREAIVARIAVAEIFVQTPGPTAGQRVGGAS